ncbi:MAG: ATP-binding cassette domain-containing protein [Chloroflexi bacterium]|nr:ATP-binding cassette domain-containing protein [Chloroflexota bacterium]
MHIYNLDHVTVSYPGRIVFDDLSWSIGDHDRIGLIGPNGAGKSTLLNVILGNIKPDSGFANSVGDITIGYLPQEVDLTPGQSLLEEALELPPQLAELDGKLAQIEVQLADHDVYSDEKRLAGVLAKQERLLEEWDNFGGEQHSSRVREILAHLGFTADQMDLLTENLSGGQKKLVALTRLAAEQPDILLMDEPDNHLDVDAKGNLEAFINRYNGAVVIVSHDRYLLDEVATKIVELDRGQIEVYHGNYTAYVTEKELRRLKQQQAYVAQQKEIARIEAAIARFELWASLVVNERHIKQARSRRKMLDRMEERGEIIEKVVEPKKLDIKLNGWRGSNKILEVCNLTMGFDNDLLFLDLNFILRYGQRVGLVGPNGAGKSVLFNLLLGEMQAVDGEIIVGPSVKIGYYAQEHQTLLPYYDRTPIEFIRDTVRYSEPDAVAFLIKLLFSYDQTRQPIRTLSGGERSRLQLARLMLQEPNLLLLDEPTNNLDIRSAEALEEALDGFEGALLIISHDRYFLDQTVDEVLELKDGGLNHYRGGYTDYLEASRS